MSKLAALIICGMCISVFSNDDGENCIFDWENFIFEGSTDTVDGSQQKVSILEEGDRTYHYVSGPYKVKTAIDDTYDAFYVINKWTDNGPTNIVTGFRDICYYFDTIRRMYVLPITGSHSDFASQGSLCPLMPGTFNVHEVKSSKELMAPSKLDEGRYQWDITYFKNKTALCAFRGNFTVLRH